MKKTITTLLAITFAMISLAQRNKVTYDFPPEMTGTIREEFIKRWETGKTLYEINCAKCHNTKKKRKTIIPDFKPEQLTGYALRVKNAQHEANMPDNQVSPEELGLIVTFLVYKKKCQ